MLYHEKEVICSMECKLNSYDKNIPDCTCFIYLTDDRVYVTEDNYDGTYTDHYSIGLSSVKKMEVDMPYQDSVGQTHNFKRAEHRGLIQILFGGSKMSREKDSSGNAKKKEQYYVIDYVSSEGTNEKIYFDHYAPSDAKKMTKEFAILKDN